MSMERKGVIFKNYMYIIDDDDEYICILLCHQGAQGSLQHLSL